MIYVYYTWDYHIPGLGTLSNNMQVQRVLEARFCSQATWQGGTHSG
jgi:hypothetical protein